jgi:hypothetical protein
MLMIFLLGDFLRLGPPPGMLLFSSATKRTWSERFQRRKKSHGDAEL